MNKMVTIKNQAGTVVGAFLASELAGVFSTSVEEMLELSADSTTLVLRGGSVVFIEMPFSEVYRQVLLQTQAS